MVLGLSGMAYLESPAFHQLLGNRINQIIPGTVDWEDMDISVLSGQIRLRGLTLKGKDRAPLAVFPSLEADLDWAGFLKQEIYLASILATSPRIAIDISDNGSVNLMNALVPPQDPDSGADAEELPLNLKIRELRIRNAELEMTIPDYSLTAPDLNIEISDFNLASLSAAVKADLNNSRITCRETDLDLAALKAEGRVEGDRVSGLNILAETSGLALAAKGSIRQISEDPHLDITADANLDTEAAARLFDLNARGTGRLSLAVKGTINNPKAALTATHGPGQVQGYPLSGLRLSAGLEDRVLTIRPSELGLAPGKLFLAGAVDFQKLFPRGFTGEMTAPDHLDYDLTIRQKEFHLARLPVENLEGSLASVARISGQGIGRARITADITAAGVRYPPMQEPVDIKIHSIAGLAGNRLDITELAISGPGVSGSGSGHLDLQGLNPDTARVKGFLKVEIPDLSVPADILGIKASGHGTLSAGAEGPLLYPELRLAVDAGDLAVLGSRAGRLSAGMHLDADGLYIDEARVELQEGVLRAKGRIGREKDPALDLEVLVEEIGLPALVPGENLKGTLTGRISAGGTIGAPLVKAAVNGENIAKEDIPIGNIRTALKFSRGILEIDRADVIRKNSRLNVRGRVDLANRIMDIRLAAPDLDLADFQETLGPANGRMALDITAAGPLDAPELDGRLSVKNAGGGMGLSGEMEAGFRSRGPLADLSRVSATASISSLAVSRDSQSLIQIRDTALTLKQGRVYLENTPVLLLSRGRLTLSGQTDLDGNLETAASGIIPLALAVPLVDGIRSATGDVRVSLTAKGPVHAPEINGALKFDGLELSLEELEQPLSRMTGLIRFTPETVKIEELKGRLDQGMFRISGSTDLNKGIPDKFSLDMTAHQIPLDIPENLSLTLNSRLRLSGTPESSGLTGTITLLEGRYYRDVDLNLIDLTARRTRKVRAGKPGIGPSFLKTVALDINVGRREPLLVDNNLAYLAVSPDLTVRGTAHNPVLAGRARVDEGTLSFQRARFEVTRGTIDFINPYQIEPVIDLAGETTIRSWTITLSVSGTPDNLDLGFSSEPSETDADIISLIAFGKTTREMGTAQGGGQLASAGMMAGVVTGPLEETLKDATGLDEVDISMEEADGATGVHVSLGADLSRQLSVSYGVDIRDGETVQRVTTYYKLLEHLLMSGFQDTGGRFGGELKYRLEFR